MKAESQVIKEYISRIEEACGERGDYVIILKQAKAREAIDKILGKMKEKQSHLGVMIRGRIENREISLFATGKMYVKGLKSMEEVEKFLNTLLC